MSLVDHLHHFQSTISEGLQQRKVYFSLNLVSDLFAEGLKVLFSNIKIYHQSFEKNKILSNVTSYESSIIFENLLDLNIHTGGNKIANKLFNVVCRTFTSE